MPSSLPFSVSNLKKLSKIGKLRFMKSGKVILRIQNGGGEGEFIDLDVSKGIQTQFHQQVISVNKSATLDSNEGDSSARKQINFLGDISQKLVVTPNFEQILQGISLK
uniref:Uncharacterized protein n=1 Tax=Strombidium rassoulzadegani TaxID=1082188 RepID=A0A7S3CL14_9SPIT|mmetsp:Transcript_12036/g.20311  ORF Transcript_12036/g.20311 Transcript_12036/m.20311 type:complete len:108 (+) Transcript_12036:157-480(+)